MLAVIPLAPYIVDRNLQPKPQQYERQTVKRSREKMHHSCIPVGIRFLSKQVPNHLNPERESVGTRKKISDLLSRQAHHRRDNLGDGPIDSYDGQLRVDS